MEISLWIDGSIFPRKNIYRYGTKLDAPKVRGVFHLWKICFKIDSLSMENFFVLRVVMVTFFGNGKKKIYTFTTDAPPFC